MNVSFEYLYRDGANYKNWGKIVLTTTSGHELAEIEHRIREQLLDGTNFVAEEVDISTLYFSTRDITVDHWWHEYAGVSWTDKAPSKSESIEELIARLAISRKGAHIE